MDPHPYQMPLAGDSGAGARSQALKIILGTLLGGAALGGTVTGISGLSKLHQNPQPPSTPSELEMPLPYPQKKEAADPGHIDLLSPQWWAGRHANSALELPWLAPAVGAAAGAGTVGMSNLVEHLIKKKRKAMIDNDMQNAQQRFQQSMLGQFKQSSADPLDDIYDKIEKCADGTDWSRWEAKAPMAAGLGISAAGILAALAARGAYKSQEGRTNEDLLQKALKQRAYLQSLRSPPAVTLTPQPVPTSEEK